MKPFLHEFGVLGRLRRFSVIAAVPFVFAGLAQAQLIDVDFNNNSSGAAHGGPSVGPTMTGAAVLGSLGDQWNGINTTNGTGIALFYSDGTSSPVSMTFTSGGGYDANSFNGHSPFAGTPYDALMEDYLFNGGVPQTITLSGLATNTAYELVLYNAADAGMGPRETFFTVNAATQSSTWDGASSNLIAGVDYVMFNPATSDSSGKLVITYTGNGSLEGDIDGFQIQPVATAPTLTVSITSPGDGTAFTPPANVAITANAVWTGGPVTGVEFFLNGAPLALDTAAPFAATAGNLPAGNFALTAVATAGGLSATSSVVNISVITFQTNESAAYTWTTFAGRAATGSADGVGSAVQFSGPAGVALDTNGNVYVTDAGNDTIRMITPAGISSTIAGYPGDAGTNDGLASNARFNGPDGITVDGLGRLFVADTGNNRIRLLTPAGTNWAVTTIAGGGPIFQGSCDSCPPGGGFADGIGTNAQFYLPIGITVDSGGNVYVADSENGIIRKIIPLAGNQWMVTTIATNAIFQTPYGVTVDSSTNIYVADTFDSEIRKITASGSSWTVATLAGNETIGTNDGTGASAQFFKPVGIAVDASGNLFVTDQVNDTIRKVTSGGTVSTLAGLPQVSGSANGTGSTARFSNPFGIAVDPSGNLYVADNEQIRVVTSAGVVRTLVGMAVVPGGADGTGSAAQFNYPGGLSMDAEGNIYVADSGNSTIREITPAGVVSTVAGLPGVTGTNDATGGNARFGSPYSLAANSAGTLYVADTENNVVRQISTAGVVKAIAGQSGVWGSLNGLGGAAQFNHLEGIALDSAGSIYVADTDNDAIRKIVPRLRFVYPGTFVTTWTVTTLAGSATNDFDSEDGTNAAAHFFLPQSLVVDPNGIIYVADSFNDEIRKITPVGTNWVVTTIAGSASVGGGSLDGVGTNALFYEPSGIALDAVGNLYVADQINSTIRKLTPVGNNWLVTTIGGQPLDYANMDGAGSAARFDQPDGIVVDADGNVYVSDSWNGTIRKGVFTAFGLASKVPYTRPVMNSSLAVTLTPPEAGGQWRFPWEVAWRNSGQAATNLVAGNYPVEFRSIPGWLAVPATVTVAVTNAGLTQLTNQYYPTISSVDTNIGGTLTVTLGPSPPAGSGWRFLGDTTAFFPSGFGTNLVAGTYLIEFAPVSGRVTPPNSSVEVQAGQPTLLAVNYLLAGLPPPQAILPQPVPLANISDLADYPFGFNGQLQTDVGYGSGVAVETNVVLTAAHLVFNDQTLSYVGDAYWYFERESGYSEPEPMSARGWYVLSGYAEQRTNDLSVYAPDTSTPQSRNLDVAALYFSSAVAVGGYGGYLPSDVSPNPWLTGNMLKMLVGYPVDGSEFGDATIAANAGNMYQTAPQPYPFALASDPVADQEVYTASWMMNYPGNSGGPLYVLFDGYYYPAAVYLGTIFNGVTPSASAVRAIDSNVVSLISMAEFLGDSGTNNSGGGVITVNAGAGIARNPGAVEVTIAPPAAFQAGGAWKFSSLSDTDYSTKNPSALVVASTNAQSLQFKPIPGWNLPVNQSVTVAPGSVTSLTNFYTLAVAWAAPAAITYGAPLGSNQLDATVPAVTNGSPGNFVYSPPAGTVLNTGSYTLSTTYTPGDPLHYGSATATDAVIQVVLPASLTVTAFNASRPVGATNPIFAGNIAGLVNGDNITAVYNCSATAASPAGPYPIVPTLLDPNHRLTNYVVSLVNGTLTVTAPLSSTIQSAVLSGGMLTFTWSAPTNQPYQIQAAADLTQTNWTTLTNGTTGPSPTTTTSEPIGANGQQFYRVVLLP